MAIVTTYVCDVTGKSGTDKEDFVTVQITSVGYEKSKNYSAKDGYMNVGGITVNKLICKDLALKLNLAKVPGPESTPQAPEVTFEGKLKALLEDHVADLVNEHLANQ